MAKFFLLVDDDRDDGEIFGEALAKADPPVDFHYIEDGNALFNFLQLAGYHQPDLIFLDLNMPGISGWQCLKRLKADPAHRHIPVIIYSTSNAPRDRMLAADLGALGMITKPTSFPELIRLLNEIALTEPAKWQGVIGFP